jgi:hypothetical protein
MTFALAVFSAGLGGALLVSIVLLERMKKEPGPA